MTEANEFLTGVSKYKADHPDEDIEVTWRRGSAASIWAMVTLVLGLVTLMIVAGVLHNLGYLGNL